MVGRGCYLPPLRGLGGLGAGVLGLEPVRLRPPPLLRRLRRSEARALTHPPLFSPLICSSRGQHRWRLIWWLQVCWRFALWDWDIRITRRMRRRRAHPKRGERLFEVEGRRVGPAGQWRWRGLLAVSLV
jgi:hypothetical protein